VLWLPRALLSLTPPAPAARSFITGELQDALSYTGSQQHSRRRMTQDGVSVAPSPAPAFSLQAHKNPGRNAPIHPRPAAHSSRCTSEAKSTATIRPGLRPTSTRRALAGRATLRRSSVSVFLWSKPPASSVEPSGCLCAPRRREDSHQRGGGRPGLVKPFA